MAGIVEDFEDATLAVTLSGTWTRSTTQARTGSWSLRSAVIGGNGTTDAVVQVPSGATSVRFYYRVSSESGYDYFRMLVGATEQLATSGEVGWTLSPAYSVAGASTITFRYQKDGVDEAGDDAAWIDDLVFTVPPYQNSLDGGTHGGAITTANSGAASGDAFGNIVGSPQYSDAVVHGPSGLSAISGVADSDTHIDFTGITSPGTLTCARLYLYRTGTEGSSRRIFALIGPSGIVATAWVMPAGKIAVYTASATTLRVTTGVALPVNAWARVEFVFDIAAGGSGTVAVYTYLDSDSAQHDDLVTSPSGSWPGGKPRDAEFHIRRGAALIWYLDDLAVGHAKLGPAATHVTRRPRSAVNSGAVHRAASW
ncbi:hypothetical protein [Spongiactinospora sp. TRM90649]|uniref:hypothetical protein n=1 Tax=Spongiactinospora sp. TRM90649 TaxID=3031114 RepID=UPI0023F97546|nr:hypothetical protein [Spongiactinospora sp. TRM90649]MDF5756644.1 hypothetical protein [Spongiactinospora sp. TRM90649]